MKSSFGSRVSRARLGELLVVGVAGRDRLLEDRRVRRDAHDGVVAHHALELATVDEVAREVVDPDALAVLGELLKWGLGHVDPFSGCLP